MSFHAQLTVQDEVFTLLHLSWTIGQHTDELGRPSAYVHGGTLEIELDAQPSEVLHFWAVSDTKRFDGVIDVFEPDSPVVRDRLMFFDASCVLLGKQFQDAHSSQGMTMRLTISANKLQFKEMTLDNKWPDVAG